MSINMAQTPSQTNTIIHGAVEGQDARTLARRARDIMPSDGVLVHVALDSDRVETLTDCLNFFAPDVKVIYFPAWDCLPYDRVSPNTEIAAQRVAALCDLMAWQAEKKRYPRILLTTVNAITQRVMPRAALEDASLYARVGGTLNIEHLQNYLASNGYMRTDTVREAGEFSIRGGIIDIFPSGFEHPVRLDLFGDEIESIRKFDPVTQVSIKTQRDLSPSNSPFIGGRTVDQGEDKILPPFIDGGQLILRPAGEIRLDEHAITNFRAGYRAAFGVVREDDPLYKTVSSARRYNGMDHWQPLFYGGAMDTLFEYADIGKITLDHHALDAAHERFAQITDFYETRKTLQEAQKDMGSVYNPLPPDALYLGEAEFLDLVEDGAVFSPFRHSDRPLQNVGGVEESGIISDPSTALGMTTERVRDDTLVEDSAKKARDFADIRALPDGDVFAELKTHLSSLRHAPPSQPSPRRGEGVTSVSPKVPSPNGGRLGGGEDVRKILITAHTAGSLDRLKGLMENAGIENIVKIHNAVSVEEYKEGAYKALKKLKPHEIGIAVLDLDHGFTSADLAVITEQDILGDKLARRPKRKRKADNFLTEVSTLDEGDLVVHIDHGVGKFIALETLKAAGTLHDCLKIAYAGGDKLFVPVENIEVLSRFGSDEGTVQLDKLGGAGWQARKARVKKNLMEIADHLLKIAATRVLKKAEKLDIPAEIYNKFAATFPYQETDDQDSAINDVIADMAGEHPMDRLVCGDVGFGKTEVAIRAAYVAAMDGAQVAIAVPTTLLARQHYNNFIKRFAGTGLRVAQLSRMVSASEAQKVKDGLRDGSINIVIGTHALFGKSVKFNHLGLLIIDEEQRFGVKQKERLKELKENVHILTLTATPIPRTLQMSLTGVKDMSLITTPPIDRMAVRSFVLPFDSMVVREALLREHYRGGQSFYVCPRIKDLDAVEETLKELVPELKLVKAHGQLTPTDLDDRMTAFYDGKYDVLLATNIIESGLDIPTANTIIVHHADMFGLAQLYQIRGRVGRSKIRAYAYLTYTPQKVLSDTAQKRLEVMESLDTLGAGFQLASHDMDIRGSGNLLGEQQSGHIKEVGVELYQQMLEDAVAAARAGAGLEDMTEDRWSPDINLGTSVLIPSDYVEDLGVRMGLYRRLSEITAQSQPSSPLVPTSPIVIPTVVEGSETRSDSSTAPSGSARNDVSHEIESFAAELIDRFGPIPPEVQNLLDIVEIKQLCLQAGVSSVDAGPKGAVIGFQKNTPPNVEVLLKWIADKRGSIKLRPDQKLVAIRQWDSPQKRVKGVRCLMRALVGLI
jgi:transcription-repair coupling factor (superfamily II helicase)